MPSTPAGSHAPRYWRLYRTESGKHVVRDDLRSLPVGDYASIRAAMKEVEQRELRGTNQIKGDIRQVEADGDHGVTYRLLFAVDGHASQMLRALVAFSKKTQKTPGRQIVLAEYRLKDWRSRREAFEKGR